MGVFHVFQIAQMVPNRAKHIIFYALIQKKRKTQGYGLICLSLEVQD